MTPLFANIEKTIPLHPTVSGSDQAAESIPSRFARVAASFAGRTAVLAHDAEWTYAELAARSSAVAGKILNRLDEKSEPVALFMEHGAPLVAAILGVLKAGKIYLSLDALSPAEQLAAMLADSRARLLLTDKANAALAHSLASERLQVLEIADDFSTASARATLPEVLPETGAWLMYTSGSTGAPKGVWQNHRGVLQHADVYGGLIQIMPEDRVALLTSCSLSASATPLFTALLNGSALCPFHVRSQGVERLAVWLRERGISVYHSVPTVFRHLARVAGGQRPFESLRLVRLGGEPVLRGDVEIFRQQCPDHCRLMHSLSSTEAGLISALLMNKQTALPDGRVPVGRAPRGVEVLLLDEQNQPVKAGDDGRIAVRSGHLSQGYWQQPDATAEKFPADPRDPRTRIFISNDLGRFLPDGSLEHLGRADSMVKIRGLRVDLAEVEAALQAADLFDASAAAAPEDASGERRLIAYIVPRAGADVSAQNCRRALRSSLPEHMMPGEFVSLSRLPQTPGGKVDRQALPVPPVRQLEQQDDKPRDRFETKLAEIWRRALGVNSLGRSDDFYELGGDSLGSVQVLVHIEEMFGVTLPPSTLIEHSTIEKLAAVVANHSVVQSRGPLVRLRDSTTGRPIFFVHNGHGDVTTYAQFVRRLPGRPIHGFQSIGLGGEGWPLTSIPDMARRYLQEVTSIDPTGPYLLAGTCMGGLVAFEMAQQLVRSGRPMSLVALIATPAPPFSGRRHGWHELATDPLRDWLRILRWSVIRAFRSSINTRQLPAYRHFIASMNNRARRRYRPGVYPGKITLITTTDASGLKEDRRLLMQSHAREAQAIAISCPRLSLLIPPAVDELAKQLQACLEAAESASAEKLKV
jgi:amino acid adenylation domain-containing protein